MNSLRWIKLFTLIFLVGVMATAVAAAEQKLPNPTFTTAGNLEPVALDTETVPGGNSGPGAVKAIRSESAPRTFSMGLAGWGDAGPSFAPQIADIAGGLTVSVDRSVTVEADGAYVVIVIPTIYTPSGYPQPISSEDRAAVIEKLVAIGIAQEDIEVSSQPYGPSSVSAKVQVGELPQVGQQVLDAVESVLGRSENHGARFSLSSEKCDQARALARRQAAPQADKTAADLAQALGIQQGNITGVVEYPATYFGYGPVSLDACGNQFQDPYLLEPFDAEPEVEVAVSLQVTYTIEPAPEPASGP
jgi:uncharacterized protein YggE